MENAVTALVHILGLVGMAGVWLVPYRLCTLLFQRRIGVPLTTHSRHLFLSVVVLLALAFSLFVASDSLPRVFVCLWHGWCTATQGGALFSLALFGLAVLVVETAWLVCSRFAARWSENAL